jgi:hypothetical protein
MRLTLAFVLLLGACSTKSVRPEPQAPTDAGSDGAIDTASDHLANSAENHQVGCDPAQCMILVDAGAPACRQW